MNKKLNFLSVRRNNQFIRDILPDGVKRNHYFYTRVKAFSVAKISVLLLIIIIALTISKFEFMILDCVLLYLANPSCTLLLQYLPCHRNNYESL
jgi:hypothetical protein